MSISMIGIDHSMAPVDIRALFAFTRKNAGEAMEKLKEQPGNRLAVLFCPHAIAWRYCGKCG
ncbi:MAG: hypothetical protein ACLVBP_16620 [Ruminococcus sp.]